MLPCECLNETLVIANCTEYGPGGNWTTIIPSPSPSPSPTPPPCTASNYTAIYGNATPSDYYFRSNVSYAYNYVFGHNLTWTHPDYYLWIGSDVNNEQNVVSVSEGYYHGWTERDVVLQILANQSKCYKPTVIFYPPATVPPWDYEFKQNCWNWTFMVQANIKDIMPGSSSVNRGSAFAARVADICPP